MLNATKIELEYNVKNDLYFNSNKLVIDLKTIII